jgi:type IV secretory pathway VirJ component
MGGKVMVGMERSLDGAGSELVGLDSFHYYWDDRGGNLTPRRTTEVIMRGFLHSFKVSVFV